MPFLSAVDLISLDQTELDPLCPCIHSPRSKLNGMSKKREDPLLSSLSLSPHPNSLPDTCMAIDPISLLSPCEPRVIESIAPIRCKCSHMACVQFELTMDMDIKI